MGAAVFRKCAEEAIAHRAVFAPLQNPAPMHHDHGSNRLLILPLRVASAHDTTSRTSIATGCADGRHGAHHSEPVGGLSITSEMRQDACLFWRRWAAWA